MKQEVCDYELKQLRQKLAAIREPLNETEVFSSYGMTKLSEKIWGNPEIQQFLNRRHSNGSYAIRIEGADMGIFIKEIMRIIIRDVEKITHNAIVARLDKIQD